jgi:hypothetical protein
MNIGELNCRKITRIFNVMDILYEVLKWVLIVLLAGFIGQFGRTMSHYLMDYFKKRRQKGTTTPPAEIHVGKGASIGSQEIHVAKKEAILPSKEEEEKNRSKAEKKALKAQLKAKKKLKKP